VYAVAFFKVMRQHIVGEVANLITFLWADNFCLNSERIIKIGQYLPQLCSNEKWSSFSNAQCGIIGLPYAEENTMIC